MKIDTNHKQLSEEEKIQINQHVLADLVEHLYEGCLPGTIAGVGASIAFFLMFYGYTPLNYLIAWVVIFNIMMLSLTGLYFFHKYNRSSHEPIIWQHAYTVIMTGCALAWTPMVLLMPDDLTRQFLALIAVFIVASGYAIGTIGHFYLCIITVILLVFPAIIWCVLKVDVFHYLIALFSLLYSGFLIGTNLRSTKWFKDSIKLKLENTLVSYQANHDILTELPNHRMLPQFIQTAIEYSMTANTNFALVSFSLNRMEVINDSLGHDAGNVIMQSVTHRLKELIHSLKDPSKCILTISRQDTFNILILDTKISEIEPKVKTLLTVLNEPFYLEQKGVKMTAAIGVSIYPTDAETPQALIMNADVALLKAKQFGGNCIEFYRAEINANLPKQLELEADLHSAIEKNQLQVYYQPLIDLQTNQIYGAEALIRWKHPLHGFIPPVHFIPLAEETGLIISIGAWVMEEACRQTQAWHKMGFNHLKIAVNVAEKQLRQENIIEMIKSILDKTSFDARFLELEITETAILDETITRLVKDFKALGLQLAVDDFGTGYSGLSYLKRFAIDKIKIDQSFIRDIPTSNDSITIVSAILAMAKELNVKTLSEGVETKEQLEFLQAKGCDYAQGYYYSKPVEASLFFELLLKYQKSSISQ